MSTLSAALDTALSSLATTAQQTALVSRNIAGSSDPGYTRKTARLESTEGGVRTASIVRSMDTALFATQVQASSRNAEQKVVLDKLNSLDQIVLDPEQDLSLTARLGEFSSSLEAFATSPQNAQLAHTAVQRASELAFSLNSASKTVQTTRMQADLEMAESVSRINDLLKNFATTNGAITQKYGTAEDTTDLLDQRDQIVLALPKELGVRSITRERGDMALYTDSGVTLFDKTARSVTFQATPLYTASTSGNAVYIDGVAVTGGPETAMPLQSGALVGLAQVRDEIAPTLNSHLDEIEGALIRVFSETDQTGSNLPPVTGLFTYGGGPSLPASSVGLAASISVDKNALSQPFTLRDGATGGNSAYLYNTTQSAGYSDHLRSLISELNAPVTFSSSSGVQSPATLSEFSASSAGWLQSLRQTATQKSDATAAYLLRAEEALKRVTGVNMDTEMSFLLNLENSHRATSHVIKAINDMITALLTITP